MDLYSHATTSSYEFESVNGRSVIPRRLPPVPGLTSMRTHSPSSSTESSPTTSILSVSSSSSSGVSSSVSPNQSPIKIPGALKRISRPLPQTPGARVQDTHSPGPSQPKSNHSAQLIVCRSCMNCITTPEDLLPASAVPPGSRAFRGFSGKASLFTEVYNVKFTPPRVQLMTTGAHTMQETLCANCSVCLGWKIVKAHERTEKWKEGKWLLELENLWLARSSDVLNSSFEKVVECEHEQWKKDLLRRPRERRGSDFGVAQEYPKDALGLVTVARERGLGPEFAKGARQGYLSSSPSHRYHKSTPSFRAYGTKSAVHLPMTVAS